MDHHQYQTLIKSLKVDTTINPVTFRSKVLLISSAAYVILFGLLAMMVALVMAPAFIVVLRMFFMRLQCHPTRCDITSANDISPTNIYADDAEGMDILDKRVQQHTQRLHYQQDCRRMVMGSGQQAYIVHN